MSNNYWNTAEIISAIKLNNMLSTRNISYEYNNEEGAENSSLNIAINTLETEVNQLKNSQLSVCNVDVNNEIANIDNSIVPTYSLFRDTINNLDDKIDREISSIYDNIGIINNNLGVFDTNDAKYNMIDIIYPIGSLYFVVKDGVSPPGQGIANSAGKQINWQPIEEGFFIISGSETPEYTLINDDITSLTEEQIAHNLELSSSVEYPLMTLRDNQLVDGVFGSGTATLGVENLPPHSHIISRQWYKSSGNSTENTPYYYDTKTTKKIVTKSTLSNDINNAMQSTPFSIIPPCRPAIIYVREEDEDINEI